MPHSTTSTHPAGPTATALHMPCCAMLSPAPSGPFLPSMYMYSWQEGWVSGCCAAESVALRQQQTDSTCLPHKRTPAEWQSSCMCMCACGCQGRSVHVWQRSTAPHPWLARQHVNVHIAPCLPSALLTLLSVHSEKKVRHVGLHLGRASHWNNAGSRATNEAVCSKTQAAKLSLSRPRSTAHNHHQHVPTSTLVGTTYLCGGAQDNARAAKPRPPTDM